MSTSNRLDSQTLGSQPVMPKNLPDHWSELGPRPAATGGYLKSKPVPKIN